MRSPEKLVDDLCREGDFSALNFGDQDIFSELSVAVELPHPLGKDILFYCSEASKSALSELLLKL